MIDTRLSHKRHTALHDMSRVGHTSLESLTFVRPSILNASSFNAVDSNEVRETFALSLQRSFNTIIHIGINAENMLLTKKGYGLPPR